MSGQTGRLRAASTAIGLSAVLVACSSDPETATEVPEWNHFAAELVAANQAPPFQVHSLALVQLAVHDALNAIEPRYAAYDYRGRHAGASLPAAVATATRDTLVLLLPGAAATLEAEYGARLARITAGPARDAGIAAGRAAAAAILARRSGDDLPAAISKPYAAAPAAPGVYQATPPVNAVIGAGLGELTPFGIRSASDLRSAAPHTMAGADYARDYDEVKAIGSASSSTRLPVQTETARFWFDAAAREWHLAARQGLADASADEWQAARTLALMSVAMFDATVTSFDTKFSANGWRPITAIQNGNSDGNAATAGDANWVPLCATPPFPEHNSTHAATGAAAAGVLARVLGDQHAFTLDSRALPGVTRTYQRFSEAAADEGLSRIYCGIHFRRGMDTGLAQGEQVAAQAAALLPPRAAAASR